MEENYKCCHYLDDAIDNQLLVDITFETYIQDSTNSINHIKDIFPNYTKFINIDKVNQMYLKFGIKPDFHKVIRIILTRLSQIRVSSFKLQVYQV